MSKQCIICCDNIDNTMIEYKDFNKKWIKIDYCKNCIDYEIKNTWNRFISNLKNVDCEASLKRLITNGLPGKIKNNFYYISKELNNGCPIKKFKFNGKQFSGKLKNLPQIDVIDKFINRLNDILIIVEGKHVNCNDVSCVDYLGQLKSLLTEFSL